MFCFSLLDAVCLLSLWFSFCGRFFGAYWHFLSVETICKLLGWLKTYSCRILNPMPWARLHPTISPSLKRKRICYYFILFKMVCHFSMVTSQKHHYTNKPITQYILIIAYVALLMAIYTPGWRAAMWIKCLAEGQKCRGTDGNRTRNPLIQSQGINPIYHGTSILRYA